MDVSIAVPGQFHAFKLGAQLQRRSVLRYIYTTLPSFALDRDEVVPERIIHIRYPEAIPYLTDRLPLAPQYVPAVRWKNWLFDRAVAKRIGETDEGVFVGFAGCSLRALRAANDRGWTTIVERSSAHKRTQVKLLREEYNRWGLEETVATEREIEREEAEYEAADYVATPSSFVSKSFINRGFSEDRLLEVPLGVDTHTFTPADEPPETFRVLFAGYVGVRKGVKYLLEAWDRLDLPKAELVIASDVGKHGRRLVDRFGSREDVTFCGYVDDIAEFYRSGSVFVFPSIEDGFGRVVAEALASGLPVVVSENTGAKDLVTNGENGFVVPPMDAEAIAKKLWTLYESATLLHEMREAARTTAVDRYTWEKYGERIWLRYLGVVGDKSK